jgi:zinc transport system substrate-binding protein
MATIMKAVIIAQLLKSLCYRMTRYMKISRPLLFLMMFLISSSPHAAEPIVLVTIKPLAWIVKALAPAGADVQVLVPDSQSPHDYQLRPADMARIQQSALLVWVGPGMEPWLDQIADHLPANRHLALLPHAFHDDAADEHEQKSEIENEHTEDAMQPDSHIWLDPLALCEQSTPIARALIKIYPSKTNEIKQRLAQFLQSLIALDKEIAAQFAPLSQPGFVVYHDGYQRIVQRYRLNQRAAVWHHESIPAGAKERAELLALLNSNDVRCLFYEPEHGHDAVNGWLGNAATKVKMVELDPLGENVADGADAYERFMRDLTGKMAGCLQLRNLQPLNNPDKP